MSVVFDRGNRICFKWSAVIEYTSGNDVKTMSSQEFNMKNQESCKFQLSANYDPKVHQCRVIVTQKSGKVGRGVVRASINGKLTESIDITNWKDSYTLSHYKMHFDISISHSIVVICYIKWYGFLEDLQVPGMLNSPPGLKPYYNNQNLSDVIITINGRELYTHKIILAAQSPVFEAMFNSNMKEAKENRIFINDVDVNIMKIVLEYLYTGETPFKDDIATVLLVLAVADKYQIATLKAACSIILYEALSPDNAMFILKEIDKYDVPKLQERTIMFVLFNKKEMETLDGFEEICCNQPKFLFDSINFLMDDDDVIEDIMNGRTALN